MPLEGMSLVGNRAIGLIWHEMGLLAVYRLPGNGQRRQGIEARAVSTRKQEEITVVTHPVIVELSGGARWHLKLCYRENSDRGVNRRTDTSRISLSFGLCPPESSGLDFLGSCCCAYPKESAQHFW